MTVNIDPTLLSPKRAARINAAFEEDVEKAVIPGAVVLIARRGKLAYLEAFGYRDREKSAAMAVDSIFRIASMTKPMVSVAIMMLAEEGRVRLVSPVSTWLPEMAQVRVGVEEVDAAGKHSLKLERPRREMSVQDLLRHTSGLTYGQFGDSLVKQAYRQVNPMAFLDCVGHVPAFPLADMTVSGKAPACRSSPAPTTTSCWKLKRYTAAHEDLGWRAKERRPYCRLFSGKRGREGQ